jgi:hypothetical protein
LGKNMGFFWGGGIIFLKYTQWKCILSFDNSYVSIHTYLAYVLTVIIFFDNSTAMYKNITPWWDSNPISFGENVYIRWQNMDQFLKWISSWAIL